MHRQQIKHLITCISNIGKISFGLIWCISGLWYNGNSCLSGVNKMNLVRLMRVVCMVCVVCVVRLVCRMHGVGRGWIGLIGTGIGTDIGTDIGAGGIDKSSKVLMVKLLLLLLVLLLLLLVVLLVVVDMSCLRRWVKMAKDSIVLKVMMYLNWRRHVVVTSSTMVNTLNVVVHVFVGISIANIETKNTFTT